MNDAPVKFKPGRLSQVEHNLTWHTLTWDPVPGAVSYEVSRVVEPLPAPTIHNAYDWTGHDETRLKRWFDNLFKEPPCTEYYSR